MPLHWTIDPRLQIFEATCDGNVALADVNEMLDAVLGANGLGYRKLFDGTNGDTKMSSVDMLGIGVRMRSLQAASPDQGPLAVRVFNDVDKARRWLDSPAVRGSLPTFDGPGASA